MVLTSNTGWRYSEIINLPIKKRDWIFSIFVSLSQEAVEEAE